ncbi:MAG: uridine kinase [Candidatus Eremiobacteraeota bacterium]|nr:uridine kinase [Candidatus Eremiobacteraeota bacterium]
MKKKTIGVAGGTGSGKTTVVKKIIQDLPPDKVIMIPQDSYYIDQSHLSWEERKKINYDHPFAFDNDLLVEHIKRLSEGDAIDLPIYSYITYSRQKEIKHIEPREIVIVEGILILEDRRIRELLDIKIFVDTDADERFIRRLKRDIMERGRAVEEVIEQYMEVVRPMHLQFVEPTKRYADIIIPGGGQNTVAIDILTTKIRSILMGM